MDSHGPPRRVTFRRAATFSAVQRRSVPRSAPQRHFAPGPLLTQKILSEIWEKKSGQGSGRNTAYYSQVRKERPQAHRSLFALNGDYVAKAWTKSANSNLIIPRWRKSRPYNVTWRYEA